VFVTGDIMSPETREFLDKTCFRYLEKPFTIAEFRAVLRGVMTDPASPGPGAAGPSSP
jgi:CheY-like chemotaxis protein